MWLITMFTPVQIHAAPRTRAAIPAAPSFTSAHVNAQPAFVSRGPMRILDIWPKPSPPAFSLLRTALSFQGLPGLIDTPIASAIPAGHVDLQYHVKRDVNRFPGVDNEKTFNFAIGLLPWLTIGGRGTVVTADGRDIERDIAANAQVLLIDDRRWWPSVAIGFNDVAGGRNLFGSRYLVLSKQLFGRLRATAGYGFGPDVLKGPFGGAELALNRYITLMGEHDTDGFNAGLRLFPLPEALEAYGLPRPSVDLIWQDGDDFAWGISLHTGLGEAKYRAQRTALSRKRFQRAALPHRAAADLQDICEALQVSLLKYGFENVRVAMLPRDREAITVVVEYENRRYNRNELDALGIVLSATAMQMPPEVTHVQAVVKRVNLPVLQLTAPVDDFLAYVNGEISQHALSQTLHITNQVTPAAVSPLAQTPIRQRSWLKLDVFVRPSISTRILTELGVAKLRFSVLPDAFVQLTPGTVFNVRANVPVTQTSHFPGALPEPVVDRILIHQALRLPQGPGSITGLTQLSIGRFTREEVGIANETALTFWDGWLFFRSLVARVGDSFDDLDQWVAWANGRVRTRLGI